MVISALVLVIVGLTFVLVQQNSNQNENTGTTLPNTQVTDTQNNADSPDAPTGDIDEEILTPPEVQPEEERTSEISFEEGNRVLSGTVQSKNQTQITITEDVSGENYIIEVADTSTAESGSYLTAECSNIQENVCQASSIDVRTAEEIN